jgi:hypothetical protein
MAGYASATPSESDCRNSCIDKCGMKRRFLRELGSPF